MNSVESIRVEGQQEHGGKPFPLALAPRQSMDVQGSVAWVKAHREWVLQQVDEHGCVLFRNFGLDSAEDFHAFLRAFRLAPGSYLGGGGPRINARAHGHGGVNPGAGDRRRVHVDRIAATHRDSVPPRARLPDYVPRQAVLLLRD